MYNPRLLIKALTNHLILTMKASPSFLPSCPPQLREQPFAALFASQMAWVLWIPELEGHT